MALAANCLVPAGHSQPQQAGLGVLLRGRGVSQGGPADHMEETVEQSVVHLMAAAAAGSYQGHTSLLQVAADCAAEPAADWRMDAGLSHADRVSLGMGCPGLGREVTQPACAVQ